MAPKVRQTIKSEPIDEDSMDVEETGETWEPQVRFKTSDGKRFILTKSEASCFNALHMMIESYQNAPNASTEYISLPSVSSQMLAKVVVWCREHCGKCERQLNSNDNMDATCRVKPKFELTEKHKLFFNSMNELELFQFIHVANFFDIRCLFDALCQTVAKRWEGKKVEEIRRLYGIVCDYTPEEDHQMLQESKKLGLND